MTDQLERLKTALADRYTIERELGSGGMATVYLAHDQKHDRKVAIKVFRPELAAALGSERFFREIKITANLSHPHILPLLDSGEADGFLYYVMPVIEGDTLRDWLNREKQLGVDDALKVTAQIASALSYAHSHDIVHRDIKPENILFQAGEVVVADFGIALAVDSAGGTRLTKTGFSLGTPAYMSPEQVSGEQELDGRSDIYSLACVLYEMLAGDPPFIASNPRAVLAKHMTDPAPPITTVRSSVPVPVAAALTKALGKAPVDRFDTANAFSDALFASEVRAEEDKKSIVVLPFENLSPDPENEYFADGLTDELIADLSKLHSLRVISRNSAMQLKGTNKDTKTIGRELDVKCVLEGTVRRAGDRLRITAQLIDATNDEHIWTEKYDGVLEDVFDMQEQVSLAIVDALKMQLTPDQKRTLVERPIDNVPAYQCYLSARRDIFLWTADSMERATRQLENGLEIVGENATLLYGLALVEVESVAAGLKTAEEAEESLRRTREYANKILELEPSSANGHCLLGILHQWSGEYPEAVVHFEQALGKDPTNPDALAYLAVIYWATENNEKAALLADRLVEIDPLSPRTHLMVGWIHISAGRLSAAVEAQARARELEPDNHQWWLHHVIALLAASRVGEAKALTEQVRSESPENVDHWLLSLFAAALRDDRAELERLVDTSSFPESDLEEFSCWQAAIAYHLVGETEKVMDWLERAIERGYVGTTTPLGLFFGDLSGNPRFDQIRAKAKQKMDDVRAQMESAIK